MMTRSYGKQNFRMLLGKHLKLFTDRAERDHQITVTIERIV